MTNHLLRSWNLRIKFVDDITVLEIIPRNSILLLGFAANDIHRFSIDRKMKLNSTKCKEMTINFLTNLNFIPSPIIIGTNTIQSVSSYKLLGVTISSDLSWNRHVEYVTKKANKTLYSLRILKRCGIPRSSLVKVYSSLIRPVLEYAVPVWQNLTQVLACSLENVQKRALHIIFPTSNYPDALVAAGLHRGKKEFNMSRLCTKATQTGSPH